MPEVGADRTQRLRVDGMKCLGCASKVEQALRGLSGVTAAEVSLEEGIATIAGDVQPEDLIHALSYTDYQARPITDDDQAGH